MFCYENNLGFPIYILNKTFENSKNLLLVTDGDKSHYVYIKDLCFTKQRVKTKNTFAKVVHSVLVVKICWEHIKKLVWALMAHNLWD